MNNTLSSCFRNRLALLQEKAESLPPEPPAGGPESAVACAVRFPDGSRLQRRFLCTASLVSLFDWVDSVGAVGYDPHQYKLISQFPRRVLDPRDLARTFEAAGLSSNQEVFLLEALKPPEESEQA